MVLDRVTVQGVCPPVRVQSTVLVGAILVRHVRTRMASYVDRILKGAKPGDLPVERVAPYELILNLKISREIGVSIKPDVIKRADRVIE